MVHRDHGVGKFIGLSGNEGAQNNQEFLSLKYSDGEIIRVNVSHLDLVDFFANNDADFVKMDSLSKKAIWKRSVKVESLLGEFWTMLLGGLLRQRIMAKKPLLRLRSSPQTQYARGS